MNKLTGFTFLAVAFLLLAPGLVFAQYTIVLKTGRRITVQSYREEGGIIKFQGFGGEIGIDRDQVEAILRGGEAREGGMVLRGGAEAAPAATEQEAKKAAEERVEKKVEKAEPEEKAPTLEELRAKEEQEYQKKVKEITARLKAARDRYLVLTRGTSGPEPTVPLTEEEMRTRADDLISRLRDVQQRQSGATYETRPELVQPAPLSGAPPPVLMERPAEARPSADPFPPGYTEKQRQLSEARQEVGQLEKERDRLIEEMRQKNFNTSGLFLE